MYQEFFQLQQMPFTLTPNPNFFCHLKSHQEALNTLVFCLKTGEGFIKITGEVGTGKTLLCRKLLEILDESFVTAYIPNPDLTPIELRKAFARELGIEPNSAQDQHELLTVIYHKLIDYYKQGKHVVLLIDEAQSISNESLETLRLLTNLETISHKLMQVVLFAQPELDTRLNKFNFRQLKQRISFSYQLPTMNREDLDAYIHHRLAISGYTHGDLFTKKARKLLFHASRGIPRLVNIISHKALLTAYGAGNKKIDCNAMRAAVIDTEAALLGKRYTLSTLLVGIVMSTGLIAIVAFLTGNL